MSGVRTVELCMNDASTRGRAERERGGGPGRRLRAPDTSMPRPATSVHTIISNLPSLNSLSAASRPSCDFPPCSAVTCHHHDADVPVSLVYLSARTIFRDALPPSTGSAV